MREIFYLTDLPGQVEPIRGYVLQALQQQEKVFSPEQFAIARTVIENEFSAKSLERATLEQLEEQPQREFLDEAIEWLNEPVVRKVMESRASAWSPAGLSQMKSFMEQQQQNPPSQRRVALIEQFDEATNASGFSTETMLLSAYGVSVMYDALKPVGERMGPQKLKDAIPSQRGVLLPIFKETSAVAAAFSFRELSDDELEGFVTFAASKPGQWLYTTTSTTFLNALLGKTANLGTLFLAALPENARTPIPLPDATPPAS